MSSKNTVNSANITGGANPLSQATIHNGIIYLQGCTGRHPTNGNVGKGIEEQTRYTLERIKIILEECGSSLENVLTNTCYLTKAEDLQGFNKVYSEYFPNEPPARTAILVAFGAPDNLVEVTTTAFIA
jgi:2-iminobutanoate/2-iminopropanoate deaminase